MTNWLSLTSTIVGYFLPPNMTNIQLASNDVYAAFAEDIIQDFSVYFPFILDNIPVLLYNG